MSFGVFGQIPSSRVAAYIACRLLCRAAPRAPKESYPFLLPHAPTACPRPRGGGNVGAVQGSGASGVVQLLILTGGPAMRSWGVQPGTTRPSKPERRIVTHRLGSPEAGIWFSRVLLDLRLGRVRYVPPGLPRGPPPGPDRQRTFCRPASPGDEKSVSDLILGAGPLGGPGVTPGTGH